MILCRQFALNIIVKKNCQFPPCPMCAYKTCMGLQHWPQFFKTLGVSCTLSRVHTCASVRLRGSVWVDVDLGILLLQTNVLEQLYARVVWMLCFDRLSSLRAPCRKTTMAATFSTNTHHTAIEAAYELRKMVEECLDSVNPALRPHLKLLLRELLFSELPQQTLQSSAGPAALSVGATTAAPSVAPPPQDVQTRTPKCTCKRGSATHAASCPALSAYTLCTCARRHGGSGRHKLTCPRSAMYRSATAIDDTDATAQPTYIDADAVSQGPAEP